MATAMPAKKNGVSSVSMFTRIKQLKEEKKKRQSVLDEIDKDLGVTKKKKK